MNSEYIGNIVYSVLQGEDYRKYVMATINERFIDEVSKILVIAAEYKEAYGNQWLDKLIAKLSKTSGIDAKRRLTWVVGLNEKTIHNIAGTTRKEVIVELGKVNIEGIKLLVQSMLLQGGPSPELIIKYKEHEIKFTNEETFLLFNTIAAARLTIQGGAWSEVGKQVEKALLYVLFNLLSVPPKNYILDQEKINEKAKEFGTPRDIDGILVNMDNKHLTVELKLLGIGNPEIIDEALAREPNLFITDQSTPMMKEEVEKRGITIIILRDAKFAGTIMKLAEFFDKYKVPYSANPKEIAEMDSDKLKEAIMSYIEKFSQDNQARLPI